MHRQRITTALHVVAAALLLSHVVMRLLRSWCSLLASRITTHVSCLVSKSLFILKNTLLARKPDPFILLLKETPERCWLCCLLFTHHISHKCKWFDSKITFDFVKFYIHLSCPHLSQSFLFVHFSGWAPNYDVLHHCVNSRNMLKDQVNGLTGDFGCRQDTIWQTNKPVPSIWNVECAQSGTLPIKRPDEAPNLLNHLASPIVPWFLLWLATWSVIF